MLCSADFQRALSVRPCAKSAHFSVHHVLLPAAHPWPKPPEPGKLSTDGAPNGGVPVDDLGSLRPEQGLGRVKSGLGMVVPKRNARRAVTRNLVKRHIRAVFGDSLRGARLASGVWVVRLRCPFDKARFVSAKSDALGQVVREELADLLGRLLVTSPAQQPPSPQGLP